MQKKSEEFQSKTHNLQLKMQPNLQDDLSKAQLTKMQQKKVQFFCKDSISQHAVLKVAISQKNKAHHSNQQESLALFKFLLLITIISQLSMQIGLLVIQYDSSKIPQNIFFIFITITTVMTMFNLLTLWKSDYSYSSQLIQVAPDNLIEHPLNFLRKDRNQVTIPKLKKKNLAKDDAKTLKLNPLKFQRKSEDLDIDTITKLNSNSQTIQHDSSLNAKIEKIKRHLLNIFLASKLIHNLFVLVLVSICFGTLQNPFVVGFNHKVVMLLISYILLFISSALALRLYFKATQHDTILAKKQQEQKCPREVTEVKKKETKQSKLPSKISIEQYIHQQEGSNQNAILSIKKIKSITNINSFNNDVISKKEEIIIFQQSPIQNKTQREKGRQKSVLKNTRSWLAKNETLRKGTDEISSQNQPQRRKVQINFTNIQYFQYCGVSPRGSVTNEDDQTQQGKCKSTQQGKCKSSQKSRFTSKNKYQKDKMILEAKRLQKIRENRQREKAKSVNYKASQSNKDQLNVQTYFNFRELFS